VYFITDDEDPVYEQKLGKEVCSIKSVAVELFDFYWDKTSSFNWKQFLKFAR